MDSIEGMLALYVGLDLDDEVSNGLLTLLVVILDSEVLSFSRLSLLGIALDLGVTYCPLFFKLTLFLD